ncbi:MAG: tetratricopeptide repeat protein [Flavobacteriales bacterium]|nr:tetratricopeptide repeat protein [Flavobacteriales bacterium]
MPIARYFHNAAFLLFLSLGASDVSAQEARINILRGDSLLRLEKPQRALEFYDKAIKEEPSATSFLARARAWYALDRMDHFIQDVEQALRKDSTSANAHYQRAVYAFRSEDLEKAEEHSTRAIDLASQPLLKAQAQVLRGEVRTELKHYRTAIADLEAGVAGTPSDPEAFKVLARLYDQEGRHEDALRVLEQLCALEPGQVGHWSNRGFELTMLGRYDEASKMIEEALSIDKDEPVALSNRAYVNLMLNKDAEAWSDVERSLRSYPANPFALRTRAMLRLRKGDRAKACEDLTLAKALGGVPEVEKLIKENCDTSSNPQKRK